ncbi:MAG: hypothetical protein GX801_06490 [Fibrobacter sp.]|nr:hypothetical protein [Fibrobacter sp.]
MRIIMLVLMAQISLWAQMSMVSDPNEDIRESSSVGYEERPGVGVYFEPAFNPKNFIYNYQVNNIPFDLKIENSPLMGVGAHLPFNGIFGLNGVVAFQQSTFDYKILASQKAQNKLLDETILKKKDLNGSVKSRNLIVQAGFEAGYGIYKNYQYQLMIKPLAYASLTGGKNFFDDSKFENTSIWGYAYGAALRMAWGPVAIEGGIRTSHFYWHTNFSPEDQTGEQIEDDKFMVDYDTPIAPFVKATWALY